MRRTPGAPLPRLPDHDPGHAASAAVRAAWWREGLGPLAPRPADHVVLARGMPVAPWMRLRPVEVVWSAWLRGLRALWLAAQERDAAPNESGPGLQSWDAWQAQHVHSLHLRRAEAGSVQLAELLADPRLAGAGAHLIGHSVGGAAVLRYLVGVRVGRLPAPVAHICAAITLDAALTGIAGAWSGMRTGIRRSEGEALADLGAWARQRGISVLTISNERDIWSHRAIGDLPYVGLRLGPPLDLGAQLNGAVHGWLRRMPQVVEALWLDAVSPPPAGRSSASPMHPAR